MLVRLLLSWTMWHVTHVVGSLVPSRSPVFLIFIPASSLLPSLVNSLLHPLLYPPHLCFFVSLSLPLTYFNLHICSTVPVTVLISMTCISCLTSPSNHLLSLRCLCTCCMNLWVNRKLQEIGHIGQNKGLEPQPVLSTHDCLARFSNSKSGPALPQDATVV